MQRYNIIFKFPQLAHFYFLSWRIIISSVGELLFPQLAPFCFLSWRNNIRLDYFSTCKPQSKNMPQKMKILAMAIASTFNSQRKYLRWHLKVCSFFGAVIKTSRPN